METKIIEKVAKNKPSFMEKVSQRASALNLTRLSSNLVLATGSSTLRKGSFSNLLSTFEVIRYHWKSRPTPPIKWLPYYIFHVSFTFIVLLFWTFLVRFSHPPTPRLLIRYRGEGKIFRPNFHFGPIPAPPLPWKNLLLLTLYAPNCQKE